MRICVLCKKLNLEVVSGGKPGPVKISLGRKTLALYWTRCRVICQNIWQTLYTSDILISLT